MDLFRKLGIAVVFIVPTFVFSGLLYSWFDGLSMTVAWLAVLAVFIIMIVLYTMIITGKFSGAGEEA